MNRIKKGFQKTKSHQTFKSLSERLSGQHVMAASCLTMAIAIAIAFGFGARATNPILHESAIKAASDRMEAQLHGYNVSDTVTSTRSNPIAKLSKEPIFSTPKGIAEGNKVIGQASVSSGGGAVYDAEKRIVKIVETRAGIVTSTKQFVWAGNQLCEERDASGHEVPVEIQAECDRLTQTLDWKLPDVVSSGDGDDSCRVAAFQ